MDAPQIFVPEDVRNGHCSVLTVCLERFVIGSLVRERLEPHLITKELVDAAPDHFYDSFTLTVSSINLSMVSARDPVAGWQWEEFERSCGVSKALLDPFDVQFTLQHCLVDLPYLPAFKLATSVPALNAYLGPKVFLAFVTSMRTIITDEEEEPDVDPSTVSEAAMVPFSDQEILSLAEPHAGVYIVDSERARKLQATFEIGAATILVHHEKTQSNIAQLVMTQFQVNVAKLSHEVHFSIFLQVLCHPNTTITLRP